MNSIAIKDISQIDLERSFFHYTNKQNLNSIAEVGLEPRIGDSALHVENTPKVFFAEGEKGILAMMDVWLRWLTGKIYVGKFKYWFATAIYMRLPFCIKSIPNRMTKKALSTKERRFAAYAKMQEIWGNSVFLILDLEEGIDFSYNDIDEVKSSYYESFLKLLYPKDSDFRSQRMEYWNMHTYSNRGVKPQKIAMLNGKEGNSVNNILVGIAERNIEEIKKYEFLYEYYTYIQDLESH